MGKQNKIEREKMIVRRMIEIYCRHKEGNEALCDQCEALIVYAEQRLDRCRFGNGKPTCKRCPIHCYRPDMRERIRQVMRYSGPRMIFYYPIEAFTHSR